MYVKTCYQQSFWTSGHERIRIAAVLPLKFLLVPAVLALVFGLVRISLWFRARALRVFAARCGLQYIGPTSFRWKFLFAKVKPPVAIPFSLAWWPANEIRQVWNVIEGQQSGLPVLMFDSLIWVGRGKYRTFLACKTEQNPFGLHTSRDREVPWATWSMGIRRLEDLLNTLQVGSGMQA